MPAGADATKVQDFDPGAFDIQCSLLVKSSVRLICDVGANVGNTVASYRERFPYAYVYAFEPFVPVYERLARRFAGDEQVRPFNLAVGRRSKARPLYVNEYADTNSLLPRPSQSRRYYAADNVPKGTVAVQVIALDDFAQEHGIAHIDILKLDIQGSEADALAGARKLLQNTKIDVILSEVFFAPHYDGAALFHQITAYLDSYGYTLYSLFHLVSGGNGQLRFADAVFVSGRIRREVIDARPPEA